MDFPQINDNDDQAIRLLEQIAQAVSGEGGEKTSVQNVKVSRHSLQPGSWVIEETSNLDDANQDGTITLEPGETVDLARFYGSTPGRLLAVGAVDKQNVEYFVEVDNKSVAGGRTESPLGLLNSPFSLVDMFAGAVPFEQTVAYRARRPESANGSVDMAARIHVERERQQ